MAIPASVALTSRTAGASVPFTGHLTGRAYAFGVNGIPLQDTGNVNVTGPSTTYPDPGPGPCVVNRHRELVVLHDACAGVVTSLSPPSSTATASVSNASYDPTIEVTGATATSTSNCVTSSGSGRVQGITINGSPVTIVSDPAPNTSQTLPDGTTVVLNEQYADDVSLTVNAVDIITPNQVNEDGPPTHLIFASAKSDIHSCPPPTLTESPGSAVFHDPLTLTATLLDPTTNSPLAGQPITFTLGALTCTTVPTDSTGSASCSIPNVTENATAKGGPSSLTMSIPGNGRTAAETLTVPFTIAPEDTAMTYAGDSHVLNGASATIGAVLTEDGTTPLAAGHGVTLILGAGGPTPQSCAATVGTSGKASCTIASVNQTAIAVGSAVPVGAQLNDLNYIDPPVIGGPIMTVTTSITITGAPGSVDYHDAATFAATLGQTGGGVVSNAPLTFTLSRAADTSSQSCTATTNGSGSASCSLTPVTLKPDPGARLAVSFAGDASHIATAVSQALPITREQSAIVYTGDTRIANTFAATMSARLDEDTTTGEALAGRTIHFTMGPSTNQQTCDGVTNSSGIATCTITPSHQGKAGDTVNVSASFAGDDFYVAVSTSTNPLTLLPIMTGRAYSLGLGSGPSQSTINDTGDVRTISNGTTGDAPCLAPNPQANAFVVADAICSSVITADGTTTSQGRAADIIIPALGLRATGAMSSVQSSCDTRSTATAPYVRSVGSARFTSLTIGSTPYTNFAPAPNFVVFVAGFTIILNEQVAHPDGSLTVNAIHVVPSNPLVPDMIALSSTAGTEDCGAPH